MLIRLFNPNKEKNANISKRCGKKNADKSSAFESGSVLEYTVSVSRKLGCVKVYLCTFSGFDESKTERHELVWQKCEDGSDVYTLKTDFSGTLLEDGAGLVFCRFVFKCDDNTSFYTNSINNIDFELTSNEQSAKPFRILFYDKAFETPDWAKCGVMYHIFVDRFYRGSYTPKKRDDCILVENWNDVSKIEFPEYAGAHLSNNTFFGGNLYGIAEKLDYLKELGVTVLYLSPVFKAYSNHKYDTGDYEQVDEMFGGNKALSKLIDKAHALGMKIILDGVFNHTGDDSKYFNRNGKYASLGAYQSKDSEYFSWYDFEEYPEKYKSWWGIKILPKLRTDKEEIREYFTGKKGIVRKWLNFGIDGWRLDVADELPDEFLDALRSAAKDEKNDSLIIGEVWENAADKISYGKRRKYFLGSQLDCVMNYPIKNAILDFVMKGNAELFYNNVTDLYSSYPPVVSNVLMNVLGTHDTERILTVLSGVSVEGLTNTEISKIRMTHKERNTASRRLLLASILQFTLPGMPCVFYGDEAGMEGYGDPFCRRTFPWENQDISLIEHYKKLCRIKYTCTPLHDGKLTFAKANSSFCIFKRTNKDGFVLVAANAGKESHSFNTEKTLYNLMNAKICRGTIEVPAESALILSNLKITL